MRGFKELVEVGRPVMKKGCSALGDQFAAGRSPGEDAEGALRTLQKPVRATWRRGRPLPSGGRPRPRCSAMVPGPGGRAGAEHVAGAEDPFSGTDWVGDVPVIVRHDDGVAPQHAGHHGFRRPRPQRDVEPQTPFGTMGMSSPNVTPGSIIGRYPLTGSTRPTRFMPLRSTMTPSALRRDGIAVKVGAPGTYRHQRGAVSLARPRASGPLPGM